MSEPHKRNLPVPFFSQRENKYKWQRIARNIRNGGETIERKDADPAHGINAGFYQAGRNIGEPVSLAWMSCNITSLCMILHYFGITKDTPDVMMEKFYTMTFTDPENNKKFLNDFRHAPYVSGQGPNRLEQGKWLKEFAQDEYKIPPNNISCKALTLEEAKVKIAAGYPVWFSFGATTGEQNGHIAVIRGFTEEDDIIINDPYGDAATPEGYLGAGNKGPYYSVIDQTVNNKYYGLGNGDNCVLRKEEFKKIITEPKFNQTLVITYPHYWSFPFRKTDDGEEKWFRFSDHTKNVNEQPAFRERQVEEMLKSEVTDNAGYPITTERLWHDGIHITGNKPVYAVGPGRLVAARIQGADRMPRDGSSNFVLVRHRVMIDGRQKEFYSHYMHLAPVDIKDRIKRQIGGDDPAREKDWIDQLIERIRPKRAIVYIKNPKADGREGNTAPLVYRFDGNNMVSTGERLPDRSIIYLCLVLDSGVKQRMEEIAWNEELRTDMLWFYNAVNKTENYIKKVGNTEYYAYYHSVTGAGSNVTWEIRYVLKDYIKPQNINVPEYVYYRRMLAKLLRGETAVFCKEDTRNNRGGIKKDGRSLFIEKLKEYFPEPAIQKPKESDGWPTVRNVTYNSIKEYYRNKIFQNKEGPNGANIIIKELTERICNFGRSLLSFPADMLVDVTDAFTIFNHWYKDLIDAYREVLAYAKQDEDHINYQTYLVTEQLNSSIRSNVDYYIEVSGNTKLGTPGRYKDQNNVIHFEIFTDDAGLVTNTVGRWNPQGKQFVSVPGLIERNNYFVTGLIISKLREANFFKETSYFEYHETTFILSYEIENYYKSEDKKSLEYAIVQHLHSHADIGKNNWEECIKRSRGLNRNLYKNENLNDFLAYKWFSNELIEELKPLTKTNFGHYTGPCAVFYHPVRFLAWLDGEIIESTRKDK
jgi:hypothetical protein